MSVMLATSVIDVLENPLLAKRMVAMLRIALFFDGFGIVTLGGEGAILTDQSVSTILMCVSQE